MTIVLLPLPTPLSLVTAGDAVKTCNWKCYAITFIGVPHLAIEKDKNSVVDRQSFLHCLGGETEFVVINLTSAK